MTDPYAELGLSHDADETAIRARYLELVREFPPEKAPERFAAVRAAYDALRDPEISMSKRLFSLETTDSLLDIQTELKARLRRAPLSPQTLLQLAENG